MTLEQQLKILIDEGEKHGLNDAAEFLKVFIQKQEYINAKQHKHPQIQKNLRSNGDLSKVRGKA